MIIMLFITLRIQDALLRLKAKDLVSKIKFEIHYIFYKLKNISFIKIK